MTAMATRTVGRGGWLVIAVAVALAGLLSFAVASASAAFKHERLGSFDGSDAPGGPLRLITGVAPDTSGGVSDGDVYVANFGLFTTFASSVFRFDADGNYDGLVLDGSQTPAGSFGLVSFASGRVGEVAVDGSSGANSGDLYVADTVHGVVDRFDSDGTYDCQITGSASPSGSECNGSAGSEVPQGSFEPTGLAVDPTNGELYVGDGTHAVVHVFSPSGAYLRQVSDSHITEPGPIAVDGGGNNLYVANINPGSGAKGGLAKFHEGAFVSVLLDEGISVGVDQSKGFVHAYDAAERPGSVVEYDAAGDLLSVYGREHFPSRSSQAFALGIGPTGRDYVGHTGEVHIFSPGIVVPDVTTGPVSDLSETAATLGGEVAPDSAHGGGDVTGCRFEYGTDTSYGQSVACSPAAPYSAPTEVSGDVSGLSPATTYHYRLVAENANDSNEGSDRTFITRGPPAIGRVVATARATDTTVHARIDPFGYETTCEVQYVDEAGFQASGYADAATQPCAEALAAGFGEQPVKARLSGLDLNTTYHYRVVATNQGGTDEGPDQTFETFGIDSFSVEVLDEQGDPYTQAGGHPYEMRTRIEFNTTTNITTLRSGGTVLESMPAANLRDVYTELPVGLVGNPTATPRCERREFLVRRCTAASQVGSAQVRGSTGAHGPLYNLVPPEGVAARLGFLGTTDLPIYIDAKVRSGGDYGITAASLRATKLSSVEAIEVTIWGVPADDSHDAQRSCSEDERVPGQPASPCPLKLEPRPFLAAPTSCSGDLSARVRADSWGAVGEFDSAVAVLPGMSGCGRVPFVPSLELRPDSSVADSPTGLAVELEVPQRGWSNPDGLVSAHLKDAVVRLPEGLSLNPSAADGLGACSPGQIALDSAGPAECPGSSRIGRVRIETPLLDHPLRGGVFQAAQGENPFGSTFAIYIAVHDPESGVVVKLPGKVAADPVSGRLTARFAGNPQLPFSRFELRFKGGARGVLTTPAGCGGYEAVGELSPWSGGPPAAVGSRFEIDRGCGTGGFEPGFEAGTAEPLAGEFSPLLTRVSRGRGERELGRIDVELPKGLVARVRGVELCSEERIAQARGRSGAVSRSRPACPAGSRVGSVTVGSGSGPSPFYPRLPGSDVSGRVFLTEAYTGSRFPGPEGAGPPRYGLLFEVPAVAGPFDLGTVLVRAAVYVDPRTAELTVVSDPMPRILEGIPLDVRDLRVEVDRERFALNPTSCEEKRIGGRIVAQDGAAAAVGSRFQVGGCGDLGLRQRLRLRLAGRGQVRPGGHPSLRAVLGQPEGQANLRGVRVVLPRSLALDPANARGLCELEDGTRIDPENHCPRSSIVGRARAVTPLLDEPLEGPVFFVKNVRVDERTGNRIRTLPMLVVALRGEIAINLRGESNVRQGRLVNTFAGIPDAAVSRFRLRLRGGRGGILAVTGREGLCSGRQLAGVAMAGHNGRHKRLRTRILTPCRAARRALVRVGGASWRAGRLIVRGHAAGRRPVTLVARCGAARAATRTRPNPHGWWRAALSLRGRCKSRRKARVVARYAGRGPAARRSRTARTVRRR